MLRRDRAEPLFPPQAEVAPEETPEGSPVSSVTNVMSWREKQALKLSAAGE